jgi:hypothetical protein
MNDSRIFTPRSTWPFAFALAFACAPVLAKDAGPPAVRVDWSDPATLSEVRESACRSRVKPAEWLGELARYLQQRAARVLAPGQHLDVTITDIRRAGVCEPWRGAQWEDVRIVKDIYPPRIDLRYALTAADGTLVRKGENTLRDAAFLSRAVPFRADDPLRYEKRMLDDWLHREFATAPAPRRCSRFGGATPDAVHAAQCASAARNRSWTPSIPTCTRCMPNTWPC